MLLGSFRNIITEPRESATALITNPRRQAGGVVFDHIPHNCLRSRTFRRTMAQASYLPFWQSNMGALDETQNNEGLGTSSVNHESEQLELIPAWSRSFEEVMNEGSGRWPMRT